MLLSKLRASLAGKVIFFLLTRDAAVIFSPASSHSAIRCKPGRRDLHFPQARSTWLLGPLPLKSAYPKAARGVVLITHSPHKTKLHLEILSSFLQKAGMGKRGETKTCLAPHQPTPHRWREHSAQASRGFHLGEWPWLSQSLLEKAI